MPHDQEALITRIAAHNPRVIVVLETGGPVLMPRRESVPAILHAFYAGAVGGETIAALLFGHVSPSGRLPFTIPLSEEDLSRLAQIDPQTVVSNPVQPVDRPVVHRDYRIEGSDIGYRWFSRIERRVAYPFGHGLSYACFTHSDFALDRETLTATLCVTSTGRVPGAEVVKIYALHEAEPAFQPRLVGFGKNMLKAGASGLVTAPLEPRLLARVEGASWRRLSGTYRFELRRDALTPILGESISVPEWTQSPRHETAID